MEPVLAVVGAKGAAMFDEIHRPLSSLLQKKWAKTQEVCRRHGISDATFYIYGRVPRGQEGSRFWSGGDRLPTSIRRHLEMARPNGKSAHTLLGKWSASRAIIKVRVRCAGSIRRPFSDPSSNLAQPSRSSAIRLATGQHSPHYPCVRVGDRDRRAVITAPLAKFVHPHTSRVVFSDCRADNCSRAMNEKCP